MKSTKYFPWLTGISVFILYLLTIAPSVIQIDSGELTAVQILAGIAHPTGYPLFTITGYIWSLVPLPVSGVMKMNILAALYCSAGISVFILTSVFILNNREHFGRTKKLKARKSKKNKQQAIEKPEEIPQVYIYLSAIASGLFLAFSKTYWFQSTSVEVYSLHVLLLLIIIYTLLTAYVKGGDKITDRYWLVFSLMLAMGFSNHMTTLLILPGTAYLYFLKYRFTKKSFQRLGIMIGLFITLLIIFYAYLPLRSSQNPVLDWGHPVDLERILRHISGKQYQVWLFSSSEAAKKQLNYFVNNLPSEFALTLLAAAAGFIISAVNMKKLSIFLAISFVFGLIYSINYDIADIDSYFLICYLTLAYFSMIAVFRMIIHFHSKKGFNAGIAAAAAFVLVQVYINYSKVDQSGNYVFEDYSKAVLNSVTPNSVILSYQWDYLISPAYYFQYVENYRRDVSVVDKELLRRSWYYNQIETNHPGLIKGIMPEVTMFIRALQPFERDEKFDSNLLENLYRKIMTGLVTTNLEKKNVYIAPEMFENEMQKGEFALPEGYTLVPDLFLFKVVKGNGYVPAAVPDFRIRFDGPDNQYTAFIKRLAGAMLTRRAIYEMQFDKKDRARIYLEKIRRDIPDYSIPANLEAVFN